MRGRDVLAAANFAPDGIETERNGCCLRSIQLREREILSTYPYKNVRFQVFDDYHGRIGVLLSMPHLSAKAARSDLT